MSTTTDQLVVCASDETNPTLAGHDGQTYISPPQSRERALALAALLLGHHEPLNANGEMPCCWRCPIAGGQRTVTVRRAA